VNINFGYHVADEVRAKFHLKLWNVYAFFCNYARLDGFDPGEAQVSVADRLDIDRWILSDLQLLIKKARESFESFNVMAFCLEAESFVDDRLSNWYVRRNRRRFWSKNAELDAAGRKDKLAAYQTLYTVLTTLTKLIAPVTPFLAEVMWGNLGAKPAESVHLAEFPEADGTLIDRDLSDETEALLRLVTLGGAARNVAKIKVRQPVAELRVATESPIERRAVERFAEQLREELNVKRVTLSEPMLRAVARLNKKSAAPKLGPRLKEAEAALSSMDAGALRGSFELAGTTLEPADVVVEHQAPDGWAGVADRGTQVMIDTRISEELKAEGLAREVIRFVQDARKKAGLDVADKIALHLGTESDVLKAATGAHKDTIAAETQVAEWLQTDAGCHVSFAKIDGETLHIALRKV
jgi:isoleucyl-tRNA synthetase